MKQNIIYLLLTLILFSSCQKEDFPVQNAFGTLNIESIETVSADVEVLTKATDPDFIVEVWKDGSIFKSTDLNGGNPFRFEAGAVPGKIELPEGNFQLKVFNAAYEAQTSWTELDKGEAVYFKEQNFIIEAEKINYLSVQVPMINVGVKLKLPEKFNDWFSSYTFTVKQENRSVELKNTEIVYLGAQEFSYELTAVNSDGETNTSTYSLKAVTPGTIYEVTYSLATKSLVLSK